MRKKIFLIFALIMNGMNIQYCQTEKVGANVSADTACGVIWSPAIQLSDDNISSVCPQISISGDDTVHVTWLTSSGTETMKLPYVKIISGTMVAYKDLLQDNPAFPYYVAYPVIIAHVNRVWIFFTRTSDRPLYMISSSDGGTTWSSVVTIGPDPTGRVYSPSKDAQHLAVLYPPSSVQPLKILRSTNNGQTWSRTNEDLDNYAKIALTSGSLHLVQHTWLPPASEINYRRSSNLGDTWEMDTVISDIDGYWSDIPTIAGSTTECGTELLTAWRDVKYGILPGIDVGASIISKASIDAGEHWLGENLLTTEPRGFNPTAAIHANMRAVSWDHQLDYYTFHVAVRANNNSLSQFCPMVDLTPDLFGGGEIKIAISSHAIHSVYGKKIGSTFRIFYRRGEFIQKDINFSLSVSSLQMDTTEIGRTSTDTIKVFNTGSDTMIVGTAISNNENFSVTPDDTTVAPFGESVFLIHYTPKSYGTHTGKIIFYHNGKTSPDCFDITGTAIWRKETISYQQGDWNMVSIPMKPGPVQSLPSMFSYEGSYVPRDTMLFGRGYWAKPSAGEKTYLGADVLSDTFAVRSGWNMIGSLTGEVLKSDITTIPESIITSLFYMFDGEKYVSADTIKPGRAYWVKVNQNGKIIMRDF